MVDVKKIRSLREKEGISVTAFADSVHCSQAAISNIELGIRVPSVELLERIAKHFKVTIDDLLKAEAQ